MKGDKFEPIMIAVAESELQRFRKIETENTLLKVQIEGLEKENEQLKAQFDKLLDFVAENYIEECDVCELTDTCINSEGVCPFARSNRNIKDLIKKHITSK